MNIREKEKIYLTNYNLQEHKTRKTMNRKAWRYCLLLFFFSINIYEFDDNEEKKKNLQVNIM
jgi:hypothetical protein